MLRIAVFVSGRGSNLKSLIERINSDIITAKVSVVISNKLDCPAISLAKENNIPYFFVNEISKEKFVTFSTLKDILISKEVDLIILAGFLKKIPDDFIDTFENKIINIHPALLPSFGGKGMYGMNVHKAVFESSAKVSGATVHFVNKFYDEGKIIMQRCVDISDVENPDEIAERVLRIEHELLPDVVKLFSEDRVTVENNRVQIKFK